MHDFFDSAQKEKEKEKEKEKAKKQKVKRIKMFFHDCKHVY